MPVKKILVVDDSPTERHVLFELLTKHGYQVITAESGEEGIEKAKADGRYRGRPKSIDATKIAELEKQGLGPTEIAKVLGVGRASIYRVRSARTGAAATGDGHSV
jgi:hypothetical protein